jgi:hypothetical protein
MHHHFKLHFKSDNVNDCCLMKNENIIKIENIAYYNTRKCLVAIGRKYLIKKDFFISPCPSCLIDIYIVNHKSELLTYRISNIIKKC